VTVEPRFDSGRSLFLLAWLGALDGALLLSGDPAREPCLLPALDPARLSCLDPLDDLAGLTVTTDPAWEMLSSGVTGSSIFESVREAWEAVLERLELGLCDDTCEIESLGATEPSSRREPSYFGDLKGVVEGFRDGAFEGAFDGTALEAFDGTALGALEGAFDEVVVLEISLIVTSDTRVVECELFGAAVT
jgi:hypothetical protein